MFRNFLCAAALTAPLLLSLSANAQSLVVASSDTAIEAPAPSAPVSLMQRYVPAGVAMPPATGLLVADSARLSQLSAVAGISVTSGAPNGAASMAVNDLEIGRTTIVVSSARGARE